MYPVSYSPSQRTNTPPETIVSKAPVPQEIRDALKQLPEGELIKELFEMAINYNYITEATRVMQRAQWAENTQDVYCQVRRDDAPGPVHWQYSDGNLWLSIEVEDIKTGERSFQLFYYNTLPHPPFYPKSRTGMLNAIGFTLYGNEMLIAREISDRVAELLDRGKTKVKPYWGYRLVR